MSFLAAVFGESDGVGCTDTGIDAGLGFGLRREGDEPAALAIKNLGAENRTVRRTEVEEIKLSSADREFAKMELLAFAALPVGETNYQGASTIINVLTVVGVDEQPRRRNGIETDETILVVGVGVEQHLGANAIELACELFQHSFGHELRQTSNETVDGEIRHRRSVHAGGGTLGHFLNCVLCNFRWYRLYFVLNDIDAY